MARRGARFRGWTLFLVVVLVVGAGAWRYGLLDRWLDQGSASPTSDPVAIAPPPGLHLPPVTTPKPVAATLGATHLDRSAVSHAVSGPLGDRHLGRHVRALVAPLSGGPPAYRLGSGTMVPASTTKLVTTTSALLALGPDHRFTTRVVRRGHQVVLVGGGDPFLERRAGDPALDGVPVGADVTTLATRTARALKRQHLTRVSVGYDASLFSGPAVDPDWENGYVADGVVSPIGALWVDEGRPESGVGRVADPALDAADAFAAALGRAGITVAGTPGATRVRGVRDGATVASMQSAPLSQIVERILLVSDNEGAEVLLRQVGLAQEGAGSFVAGQRAVAALMKQSGVPFAGTVLHDGSGLARDDAMNPATLAGVLQLASSPRHPELRSVVTGLPVAGFSGSLADRMDKGPHAGLGRVRAKTGTLTGVLSLAGIATDLDGDAMVFVLMADRIKPYDELAAQGAEDSAAAALGACHCGSSG